MPSWVPNWRYLWRKDTRAETEQPLLDSDATQAAHEHAESTLKVHGQVEDVTEVFKTAVHDIVTTAQSDTKGKLFSLVSAVGGTDTDPEIYQLVDLVLAGGGMLGIAQVGFVYVLEQCGLRFRSLGGASAGAITALLFAAKRNSVLSSSSEAVLKLLATAPFDTFLDIDPKIEAEDSETVKKSKLNEAKKQSSRANALFKLVRDMLSKAPTGEATPSAHSTEATPAAPPSQATPAAATKLQWGAMKAAALGGASWWHRRALEELYNNRGLYDGNAFTKWLCTQLDTEGKNYSIKDLEQSTNLESVELIPTIVGGVGYAAVALLSMYAHFPPEVGKRENVVEAEALRTLVSRVRANSKVALVAADITRQRMAVFPKDCDDWAFDADKHPANFARASMSIPIVYKPFTVQVNEKVNEEVRGFNTDFVDGGTLSNFPLEVFYDHGLPSVVTTIGVQMGGADYVTDTRSFGSFLWATYDNSRRNLDRTFLRKHAGYNHVATIPTEGFDWLDFDMKRFKQVELFKRGAETALEFLRTFRWEDYAKATEFEKYEHGFSSEDSSGTGDIMPRYESLMRKLNGRGAYLEHLPVRDHNEWEVKVGKPVFGS